MEAAQLYQRNQERLAKQDVYLGQIIDESIKVRVVGEEVKAEAERQTPLLGRIKAGQGRAEQRLAKANKTLENLLKRQSYCTLYFFITVELLAIIIVTIA